MGWTVSGENLQPHISLLLLMKCDGFEWRTDKLMIMDIPPTVHRNTEQLERTESHPVSLQKVLGFWDDHILLKLDFMWVWKWVSSSSHQSVKESKTPPCYLWHICNIFWEHVDRLVGNWTVKSVCEQRWWCLSPGVEQISPTRGRAKPQELTWGKLKWCMGNLKAAVTLVTFRHVGWFSETIHTPSFTRV